MIDLLVIGSGGAGLTAALTAAQSGNTVTVVTKTLPTAAQTSMAQGGMNAATHTPDTPGQHAADTLASAHGLADPVQVATLCDRAPETVAWLDALGMPFSRTPEGSVAQRTLGGASHPRACYAQDYTGLKLLHTLYDRCVAAGVVFVTEHFLLNLITTDKAVLGATFWDTAHGKVVALTAAHTLLATGGYGSMYHGYTTNSYGATGDGIAAVLRAGGVVSNLEFVQFHPTAIAGSMVLISEGARGIGGYLVTEEGERFVDELSPRDVVARAIFEQIQSGHDVSLDLRHVEADVLREIMPQELHLAQLHAGVDLTRELLPILPAVHYTMGGIDVDRHGAVTGLQRISAVGECANHHLHGANRLGGNSLMEIVVFGREVAGALETASPSSTPDPAVIQAHIEAETSRIEARFAGTGTKNLYFKRKILGKRLYHDLGIIRDARLLTEVLDTLQELTDLLPEITLPDPAREHNTYLTDLLEFENTLLLATATAQSALWRTESRGAHWRSDFPQEETELATESKLTLQHDRIAIHRTTP